MTASHRPSRWPGAAAGRGPSTAGREAAGEQLVRGRQPDHSSADHGDVDHTPGHAAPRIRVSPGGASSKTGKGSSGSPTPCNCSVRLSKNTSRRRTSDRRSPIGEQHSGRAQIGDNGLQIRLNEAARKLVSFDRTS
ncbi:hypothetical protein AB0383_34840 [Amycolatopsis sp. NPDC051373]|uniref:hypothetical protein n=1 Tax=Amycolatopsis sp. NPDC051373 TaxID=3155801 RepID=UPI00344EC52E